MGDNAEIPDASDLYVGYDADTWRLFCARTPTVGVTKCRGGTRMPYAHHQGLRIHYHVDGEGPPLVLQHGFTSSLKSWSVNGYVEALRHDYQLILVDARGHGASDKPHDPAAYTLALRAGDVVAVLDALHLHTATFWGYSMGGRIGFGLAKYAPERLMALIVGGMHPYERRLPAASRVEAADPDAFAAALFGRLGVNPDTLPPERREEFLANDFQALAALQRDEPSVEEILPTMTMPCLLYASDADPYYAGTQRCVQAIPHATFIALQGLDHSAAFREAGLVLPYVTRFLQAVTAGVNTPQT
jgi:pimeloyl-ACP methyl ester carboxylesterase